MMRRILRLWAIVVLGLPLLAACGSAAPDLSVGQDSLTAAAGAGR